MTDCSREIFKNFCFNYLKIIKLWRQLTKHVYRCTASIVILIYLWIKLHKYDLKFSLKLILSVKNNKTFLYILITLI